VLYQSDTLCFKTNNNSPEIQIRKSLIFKKCSKPPLRPTQTERDSATRREFSVFKNKYNCERLKILQDMQTKQLKLRKWFRIFEKY
jgi:hypothetical protein